MTNIESRLTVAEKVLTVAQFLTIAIGEDFLSRPEAAGIFKDILKETGFKTAPKLIKPETAQKAEHNKEVSN